MNIEYCREFIELAQRLNFTEAARALNITQPALSKHILSLEREFGVDLLDRGPKGVQLTEGGRILFETAGTIVNAYDETKITLATLKNTHPVRIAGHMEDADVASLMSMASMLAREHAHVTTVFDRNTDGDPIEALESGDTDLFIGFADAEYVSSLGFSCRPFLSNKLIVIVGAHHVFASRDSITWNDLRGETLVQFISSKTNPAWKQIERLCNTHGFSPKTRSISSLNDVEFFSTPLHNNVLIWKNTQKQIGFLLETGHRASVEINESDAYLTVYAIYKPENEPLLGDFLKAVDEAKDLLDKRKDRIGHER